MRNSQYFVADFPLLIKEWDYSKNDGLNPKHISYGSDKIVSWKCSYCGNEWNTRVKTRNKGNGSGCPVCAVSRRMGKKDRQVLSANYNLVVKAPHLLDEWNKKKNLSLSPYEVTPYSTKLAWWTCKTCGNDWKTLISNRYTGSGCPYCTKHKVLKGINDLVTLFPRLAEEWDYELNKDVTPDNIMPYSTKRAHWICTKCGGKWDAIIHSRSKGAGCPYCAGRRVLSGYNDLATVNPELAKEWNYELNGILKPEDIFPRSKDKVWWKCKVCDLEWRASVGSRNKGLGRCRICNLKKI